MKFLTLPGISDSDDNHWQSLWEKSDVSFSRIKPACLDNLDLSQWILSLEKAINAVNDPIILVAHSLSCLLVAHWASQRESNSVRGGFLVAVPDPNAEEFPDAAHTFRPVPQGALRFPTVVVASRDDPYSTLHAARTRALDWRSQFVVAGSLGHVNSSSGLGDWPEGRRLLDNFVVEISD